MHRVGVQVIRFLFVGAAVNCVPVPQRRISRVLPTSCTPRVIFDVPQFYALLWIGMQQLRYQTFEILGNLFVRYFAPVVFLRFGIA